MQTIEITLLKKIRTKGKTLLLTHADGIQELPKIGDRKAVSRLDNWRSLMVPGRKVRVILDNNQPLFAELEVNDDDPLVWDSAPFHKMNWVMFWSVVNQTKNDFKITAKEEKETAEED